MGRDGLRREGASVEDTDLPTASSAGGNRGAWLPLERCVVWAGASFPGATTGTRSSLRTASWPCIRRFGQDRAGARTGLTSGPASDED